MRTHKGLIGIVTLFIVMLINFNNSSAKNNFNLFEDIINKTNSSIEEYQIDIEFKSNDKTICKELLCAMNLKDNNYMQINSKNINNIEFKKNNVYGYIENIKNDNNNVIRIRMKQKNSYKNVINIKNSIKSYLNKKNINVNYNECVKAKTKNNISVTNSIILDLINKNGFRNIETVKISNGYSTVASTKQFKDIDFNCAVCKYDSGNYILIGTPQINISY